jgi:hypothetical protein
MTPIDREACERAVELEQKKSGGERLRIDQMLATEPWEETARFAAYSQQIDNMHLQPWEVPPCWVAPADIDDLIADGPDNADLHGWGKAARLLKRLLESGLSRYEPNPALALLQLKQAPSLKPPTPVK